MGVEIEASGLSVTMSGTDLMHFRDVCNAAALTTGVLKLLGSKTSCGKLSEANQVWLNRVDKFLNEMKGKAILLKITEAQARQEGMV